MTKRAIFRLLLAIIILAAAFFVYYFIVVAGKQEEKPGVEPTLTNVNVRATTDDVFFQLLEQIKDIQLSPELVFNHPTWRSLENFQRELGEEPRGRSNPFNPPGFDSSPTVGSTTTPPAGGATTTRD